MDVEDRICSICVDVEAIQSISEAVAGHADECNVGCILFGLSRLAESAKSKLVELSLYATDKPEENK